MLPKRIVIAVCLLGVALASSAAPGEMEKLDEKVFGEPTEKEALVYLIRPTSLGMAIKFWAFADQTFLGLTRGKSYTFALVPEGRHLFWSKAENIATLDMEVLGGRTYYLRQEVRMGGFRARVRLSKMTEPEAKEALEKCDYTVPTEKGRQEAAQIIAEKWDKAKLKESEKETWEEEKPEEK